MNIEKIDKDILEAINDSFGFVLFGAGNGCTEFLRKTKIKLPDKIYDNDKKKWGKHILGNRFLVAAPDELKDISDKEHTLVLIMSESDVEISAQIEKYGFLSWISLHYLAYKARIEDRMENIHIKSCMIESSSFCNAKCKFCVSPSMKRKKMNMTDEVFEQTIFRLKEAKQCPEKIWLHCLGEPFLDPRLFHKIKTLKNEFPESCVGYASNFSLPSRQDIYRILECGQDFLVISLNSNDRDEYEKIMGLDYDKTMEKVRFLLRAKKEKQSKLKITISVVENEQNQMRVCQFKNEWEKEGVEVRILKEGKWLSKELENQGHAVRNAENGICKERKIKRHICQQLYQELCVLSNGDYALCCFDGEGCMNLGNVKDMSIYDMFHRTERKKLVSDLMHGTCRLNICKECSFMKNGL